MLNYLFSNPLVFIVYILSLFMAISVHEFSHAWAADRLGDPTARLQGRLNLNPLVHIDMTGLLFLLFFGFGWGKPVEFDPYNLKDPRRDAALISIAGPASNLIFAIVCSLLLKSFILLHLSVLYTIGSIIFAPLILLNIGLGVFNILPINPLDGFKIVGGILPEKKAREWYQLERYGIIFLLLLVIPIGDSSMLGTIMNPIMNFILKLLLPSVVGQGII